MVNVGEGLLNKVATESLVLFLDVTNSMAGVGRAWKAVRALDRPSSYEGGGREPHTPG